MAKQQRRASNYYLARLQVDFPLVHADYVAGKYSSVRAAAVAAGLRKETTRLTALKTNWQKASPAERAQFLAFVGAGPPTAPTAPITVDRRLVPSAIAKIQATMTRRNLKMGDVMREIGFEPLDASLGMALARGTKLRPAIIAALEVWIAKQP